MIASAEDARLLFNRWQQDSSQLRIKLSSTSLIFDGVGTVLEMTHEALQLGGESWHFTVPLEDAKFTFSDPREVSIAAVREKESARYEFGLSLTLANGDQLVILELKDSESSGDEDDDDEEDAAEDLT